MDSFEWDVFVSHANEDKLAIATPLSKALSDQGLRVWFDDDILVPGDSIRRSIDNGLASSKHGIVILSHSFFKKEWPQSELDALVAMVRAETTRRRLIPIWHELSSHDVLMYSPMMADIFALDSMLGVVKLSEQIVKLIDREFEASTAPLRKGSFDIVNGRLLEDFESLEVTVEEVLHAQEQGVRKPFTIRVDSMENLSAELSELSSLKDATSRRRKLEIEKNILMYQKGILVLERGIEAVFNDDNLQNSGFLNSSRDIALVLYGYFLLHGLIEFEETFRDTTGISICHKGEPELYVTIRIPTEKLEEKFGEDFVTRLLLRGANDLYDLPRDLCQRLAVPAIVNVVLNSNYDLPKGITTSNLLALEKWYIGLA